MTSQLSHQPETAIRAPEGQPNVYPHYFIEDPSPFPVHRLGIRKVIPRLRVLIDAVTDPDLRDVNPVRWALYVVALGRFIDRHGEECQGLSVRHNIGKKRVKYLDLFMRTWDSLEEE